jgi:hypothetical protein
LFTLRVGLDLSDGQFQRHLRGHDIGPVQSRPALCISVMTAERARSYRRRRASSVLGSSVLTALAIID